MSKYLQAVRYDEICFGLRFIPALDRPQALGMKEAHYRV